MKDKYGRKIDYMRISITEKCNFRCFYCMPQGAQEDSDEGYLTKKEIVDIVSSAVKIGIKKIRITGGEPLIRKDLMEILQGVSGVEGVEELCLTTNGSVLDTKVEMLKRCGVTRINVSLDTLQEDRFSEITGGGSLSRVWKGIERAIELGIDVRVNSVVVKGVNDDEVEDLVGMALKHSIDVRFIELMPIGEGKKYQGVGEEELRERIGRRYEIEDLQKREGASVYYKIKGAKGRIGFINPLSNCFCDECNRIRVTATGDLKQCLNKKSTLNLKGIAGEGLMDILSSEIYNKPEKHLFNTLNLEEEMKNMNKIGG